MKRTHRLPTMAVGLALLMLPGCDSDPTGPDAREAFQNCATVRTYSVGQTVNGSLSGSSCVHPWADSYIDYYEMRLSSQRSVTLTMRSTQVDANLFVWIRATGALVVLDENSGGGLDARLTYNFPAGTYVIGAAAFDAGETGSYTLSSN
jgi:hypothetical protein